MIRRTLAVLALGALSLPAEAAFPFGNGAKRGFSSKRVRTYEVFVDVGPGLEGAIVPGHPSTVDLVLTDKRGSTLSTADGTLRRGSRRVAVSVEGGSYDRASGAILANRPDSETARTAVVTVRATYAKRPDLDVVRTIPIDWRAVLGPEPAEVEAVGVEASSGELLDDWLLPGAQVRVEVTARDVHGRTYSTDEGAVLLLPWSRLVPEADGLQGRAGKLTAAMEGVSDGYRFRAAYVDTEISAELRMRPDFQRLRGPEPDEVASLVWSVETPATSPEGRVPLGARLPVQVEVVTTSGRTFRLRANDKMRLVPERLVVAPARAAWERTGALVVDREVPAGQKIGLSLAYEGRTDLGGKAEYLADYVGSIPGSFLASGGASLAGWGGNSGRAGHSGRGGQDGREAPEAATRAEGGTNGQHGAHGEPGEAGGEGPDLTVYAAVAWALDRSEKVVVYRVDNGDRPIVRVKRWDDPAVVVESVGGRGGHGGAGGDGGSGGRGGTGCFTGDGGSGGDGGDGGGGGDGGPGGSVNLVASSADLFGHFTLRSVGGPGGAGGRGGSAGAGGTSPSYSTPSTQYDSAGNALPSPDCESGRSGVDGRRGRDGQVGNQGQSGNTRERAGTDAAGRVGPIPEELRRMLRY